MVYFKNSNQQRKDNRMNKGDKVNLIGTDITGTIIEVYPNFEASGETAAAVEIDKQCLRVEDAYGTRYLDQIEVVDIKYLKIN